MADYAPNFTARHKLIYSFEGDQHQCVTRWPSSNTQAANVALADALWTAILSHTADLRHNTWAVIGAEYCPPDSNTFLPIAAPTEVDPGTIASASGPSTKIIHTNWAGRSALGSKVRVMLFGIRWNTADSTTYQDFYVTNAESSEVGAVANSILTSGMVGPDDEVVAQMYLRVSVKVNDAWVKIRRQGG